MSEEEAAEKRTEEVLSAFDRTLAGIIRSNDSLEIQRLSEALVSLSKVMTGELA